MKFNKKIDAPTVLAMLTVFLMIIFILFIFLLIPYFGFRGLLIMIDRLNLQNLIYIDFYSGFLNNFFYIVGFLLFVFITILVLELIFNLMKAKKVVNMSSLLERILAYVALVCSNVFIVKFLTDNVFTKINVSTAFMFLVFMIIYFYFFVTSNVYKNQDSFL